MVGVINFGTVELFLLTPVGRLAMRADEQSGNLSRLLVYNHATVHLVKDLKNDEEKALHRSEHCHRAQPSQ